MTPHVSITLLRTQSDKRLADLTAAGHDRAFEAIVDRYRRPLLRYARGFLSEARAEEVVQAALVSAWAALRDDVQVRDLRPWLYRIVHNGAVNAMKRPGGDDAPLSDTLPGNMGPDVEVERREDMRRTLDGIAALPERQRAALVAVAVDGRAHAEVGRELGLSDSGVRQLVRRARVSLRTAATVLTPYPAAQWMAELGNGAQDTMTTRIAEAVAGAGTAGLAGGAVIKTGAVVVAAGAVAAGAPQVNKAVHTAHHHRAPAAAASASHQRPVAVPVSSAAPVGAKPVSLTSGPVSGGGTSQGTSGSGGRNGSSRHGSNGTSHAPAVTHVVPGTSTHTGKRRHHGDDGSGDDTRHGGRRGDGSGRDQRSGSRTDSHSGSGSHSDSHSGDGRDDSGDSSSQTADRHRSSESSGSDSGGSDSSGTTETQDGSGGGATQADGTSDSGSGSGSGKHERSAVPAPDASAEQPVLDAD